MRSAPRRMTLQLTSLLDLLLIVIFAQYMEVRDQTTAVQARATEREQRLERAEESLAALHTAHNEARSVLTREREESAALRQQNEQLSDTARRLREQQQQIGDLAAEMFRVPPELMEQALRPAGSLSTSEVEQLRQQFRELGEMRGDEMVDHLLTYSELRKRADVWEIHIAENGIMRLDTGERIAQFRAETPEQFAARLFDHYKNLPQPKGLVVMMLSWGDARALGREAALQGLPLAALRMRDDAAGRTRFEYAVLGYRPRDSQE